MTNLFSRYEQVNKVMLIPIDAIAPNPMQPRRLFEPEAIAELAQSIKENGLLQPITVREVAKGSFQLIAGERRLTACRSLGMEHIASIIEEMDQQQSATLALVENLQRQDLNFFEEAAGIANLIISWRMTQQQAAKKLGMAQSTMANKLRLLRLPEQVIRRIQENGLTERHARVLLKLEKTQYTQKALEYIISHHLNVEESERYIESLLADKKKPMRLFVIKDLRIFVNTLNRSIEIMRQAGIKVDAEKEEDESSIRYVITVSKSCVIKGRTPA